MASTKLVRKARRNKNRANQRTAKIKLLQRTPVIKNVDIEEMKKEFGPAKKAAPKAKTEKKEEAPKTEAKKEETPKAKETKKEAPKKEDAPKAEAKKDEAPKAEDKK